MSKRKRVRPKGSRNRKRSSMQVVNPNAAGIDIGSEVHYVAIPSDKDEQPVRSFKCFTADLHALADWLEECGIKTVAMESTGVYWIPLYQIVEERGFEVILVNARHVKNVPGRKTDVLDCQWLQRLHSYGLLQSSFRPDNDICVLRSYIRQRDSLIKGSAAHINRMQKALIQMNIQLHKVISDVTGVTGLRIIKAILDGERDPMTLAQMKDYRIRADLKTIARALQGDWREEHLFALLQEYQMYMVYREKIIECDQQIEKYLNTFDNKVDPVKKALPKPKYGNRKPQRNEPTFDLRTHLYRITGVDFTRVDGFEATIVETIISEVGLNPHKWPTEKHFASWLGLSPNNRITGEKVKSSKSNKVVNRASVAFRMAAQAVANSRSAIGAYYRRMRKRLGAPKAITATAHKLACIFYRMLKYGKEYVDIGMDYYERKYQHRIINNLKRTASVFGFELVKKQELTASVT